MPRWHSVLWLCGLLWVSVVRCVNIEDDPNYILKCPSFKSTDNTEVDWWVTYKVPTLSYYYLFQPNDAADAENYYKEDIFEAFVERVMKYTDNKYNGGMLSKKIRHDPFISGILATCNGEAAASRGAPGPLGDVSMGRMWGVIKKFIEHDTTITKTFNQARATCLWEKLDSLLKVYTIAFQDQPMNSPHPAFDKGDWPKAHSKIILTVHLASGSGYIIDHSYPQSPRQLTEFAGLGDNAEQRAQHMMCISFTKDGLPDILKQLGEIRPQPIDENYPDFYLKAPAILTSLGGIITGATGLARAKHCDTAWSALDKVAQQKHLLESDDPFDACTSAETYSTSGGQSYTIVAHACLKRISLKDWQKKLITTLKEGETNERFSEAKRKKFGTDRKLFTKLVKQDNQNAIRGEILGSLEWGPWHWVEVAKAMKTPIAVTSENGLTFIPSVPHDTFGTYNVAWRQYPNTPLFQCLASDHGKYAVSVEDNNYLVCFGDSNQRLSQINHAGWAICFNNEKMSKFFFDGIFALENKDDWTDTTYAASARITQMNSFTPVRTTNGQQDESKSALLSKIKDAATKKKYRAKNPNYVEETKKPNNKRSAKDEREFIDAGRAAKKRRLAPPEKQEAKAETTQLGGCQTTTTTTQTSCDITMTS